MIAASVMAIGSPAGAVVANGGVGPVPSSCNAEIQFSWPGVGFNLHTTGAIVSNPVWVLPRSRTINAAIPAGTYDIDTVAYDGNPNRAGGTPQMFEQYHLEFLDSTGAIIASTGTTTDLADGVIEATWAGPVGQVVLDRAATQIRAMHSFPFHTVPDTANSVMPICVGVNPGVAPTTTTTAPPQTTLPPTTVVPTTAAPTTTTAAPTTTTAAPTTTTAAPTTTTAAPTTTTTVKTQVLPAVEVAQTATPTDGNPSFTG